MRDTFGRPRLAFVVLPSSIGLFLALMLCTFSINFFSQEPYPNQERERGEGRTEGGREGVCVFGIQSYIHELTYPETLSPTSLRKLYFLINIFATFVQKSFRGCGS